MALFVIKFIVKLRFYNQSQIIFVIKFIVKLRFYNQSQIILERVEFYARNRS
ncbi:hypothetical protein HpDR37_12210 [Helicobacter pylori]